MAVSKLGNNIIITATNSDDASLSNGLIGLVLICMEGRGMTCLLRGRARVYHV